MYIVNWFKQKTISINWNIVEMVIYVTNSAQWHFHIV